MRKALNVAIILQKDSSMNKQITLKTKISLLVLSAMGTMSGVAIVASLPYISQHFHTIQDIDFLSKLLLTIPSLMVALFAPFFGYLVDKIGRLKPLYVGVVLFILSGTSGLYLNNFYYILAGRALLGLSVALIMTASMALVGDYFSQKSRHHFMSLQGMVVGLSGIFFIMSGGYLAQLDWRYPFYIYAVPLLFIPVIFFSLQEPLSHKEDSNTTEIIKVNLLPVYITGFFSMVLFYMLPTQLPYLIINQMDGTPSSVSYFIATAMLTNAMVAKQYHRLKARLNYQQIFVIIFLFFGTGLFIVSQASNYIHLLGATVFLGTGFGLILVNVNTWLLSLVHAGKRGRAIGILTSSFYFGQFLSPILFEPIIKYAGIQGLFFIVSILVYMIAFIIFMKGFLSK